MSNQDRVDNLKRKVIKINSVSPTYCTAKWLTSTTMLYNGFTHSCHHPTAHKIKIEDLDKSITSLHNTPTKIAARQDMLDGKQTKECDYCWNIENLNSDYLSDRHYKTANTMRGLWDRFDDTVNSKLGENINPSYMEIAFENTCNFKCTYCSPDVSSKWMDEIRRHGGYTLNNGNTHHDLGWLDSQGRIPIHHTEHNPYIAKFWEWWPELYKTLTSFRITGGEPLLTDNTWKVLDYILENPNPTLRLDINSNLGIPNNLVRKLVDKVNGIQGKCENFVLFTSAESVREHAEYTRYGMKWDLFESNIHYFLSNTPNNIRITFMTTIDVMSAASFDDFIRFVCELRKKYDIDRGHSRVGLSVNYLRWPFHQKLTLLDDEQKTIFASKITKVIEELTEGGPDLNGNLYIEEIDMLNRLVGWMQSESCPDEEYINFVNVFTEMDKRRGTDMIETFPHLASVYQRGKTLISAK